MSLHAVFLKQRCMDVPDVVSKPRLLKRTHKEAAGSFNPACCRALSRGITSTVSIASVPAPASTTISSKHACTSTANID
jgi:hypothetical protein